MMEWEEKLEFKEEGIEEGKEIALSRVNLLIQKLMEQNRQEDLIKSTTDKEFQEKLFEEFGL